MADEKKIYVTPITEGTVLDHLKPGTAMKIMHILDLKNNKAAMAMNVESKSMGKKDIVFLEGIVLTPKEVSKIALIGKGGTLNVIKNSQIAKKEELKYPEFAEEIIKCINPMCITNKDLIESKFYITSNLPLKAKCFYCETRMNEDEIVRLIK